MTAHGSPAALPPGTVVRIRVGGAGPYTSVRMNRDKAKEVAEAVAARLGSIGSGFVRVPEFPSADTDELWVNPERVIAVEVRKVAHDSLVAEMHDHHALADVGS